MEWLLGGIASAGVAGTIALGIYFIKFARDNRADLQKLISSEKELADARRDIDGYKRSIENHAESIENLRDENDRLNASLRFARTALEAATKKLAAQGDAKSVVADINSTLGELSKMSDVPHDPAADRSHP